MIARVRADVPSGYPEIGLLIDPTTGQGCWYISLRPNDLVITEEWVAYHESVPFSREQGKWYWLKAVILPSEDGKDFYGKVWLDGEEEPKEWMVKHTIFPNNARFNLDYLLRCQWSASFQFLFSL